MFQIHTCKIENEEQFSAYAERLQRLHWNFADRRLIQIREKQLKKARFQSLAALVSLCEGLKEMPVDQTALQLCVSDFGKPYFQLMDGSASPSIWFNNSHTGCYGMSVVADFPVGCDMEQIILGKERIANRFFHETERKWLDTLTKDARTIAFYQIWTMKESYAKMTGTGLRMPLSALKVSVLQNDKAFVSLEDEGYDSLRSGVCLEQKHGYGCYFHMLPEICIAVCGERKEY